MTGNQPPVQGTFDYIVVGGGTAGLALAVRLSERANITVAVIEAGPAAFDDPAINIPGRFGETLGTQYDWKFETVEQPGLGNRKLPCPRGRVLGGTSALNFMAWNRGNRQDYDAWSELGNKGWSWDDVLPYFQKSETFYPPDIAHQENFSSKYEADAHGTKGPLHTTHIREYGPSHQFWHATLNNLGVMTSPDSLAGSNVGAWNMVCTVDPATQTRSYSANAYYLPVSSRPNLTVLCETTVRNIIIERDDDDGWVAKGVRILKDGEPTAILASREVILAAGAIQSPQVLELSGVGNRSVLEAAGIPVKTENPNVGENLQDHLMTATIFEISDPLTTPDDIKTDPNLRKAAEMAYQSSQTGPWTILPCSIAYCPLSVLSSPEQLADLETRVREIAKETKQQRDKILARQFQQGVTLGQVEYLFDLGNWSPYFEGEKGKKYGTMLQMLQYPLSRGSVHLPSRSAGQEPGMPTPVIHPRFYLGPGEIDFAVMKMAQHFANEICATYPLASIIKSRVFPPAVHGKTTASETDNLYDDFVRNCTVTDWHPVGTCAMGGFEGSKAGVVDERLRVYGVRRLRVADASVMPLQVSAHIQATVYMIAEKAAAMILEDAEYLATHPQGKPTERPNRL